MTGHKVADWRKAALQYGCTGCGAAPGSPCITTGNKPSHTPHVQRTRQASKDGWRIFDSKEEQP